VHSDAETPGAALAPRSTTAPALHHPPLTGGAGLFDHSAHDAVSPSAGMVAGVGAIVLTAVLTVVLVMMNPAFESGRAAGTPNQLAKPGAAGVALQPGTPAFEGARIIATKQCVSCHTIPGVPGATGMVGPNLAGVASKTRIASGAVTVHGPEDLRKWIADPASMKPGTGMPKVELTDDELTKIVAFLETLK
jgi:cytochrome c1